MEEYYKPTAAYGDFRTEILQSTDLYTLKHISIESYAGPIVIDYFEGRKPSDTLVLVFPVLGGKNFIEKHIAKYLVESGFDAAIVNRSNEFKDPTMFDQLEEVFRLNIIRDRLALDFFEAEFGKKRFGTFGISRGAINVALTAGIDKRLQYNVLVLGGTDLVHLFRDSNQPRIEKYIQSVRENKGYSEQEFFDALRAKLRTDPKNTAQYLDGIGAVILGARRDVVVAHGPGFRKGVQTAVMDPSATRRISCAASPTADWLSTFCSPLARACATASASYWSWCWRWGRSTASKSNGGSSP
jgi:hypothetical protein